MGIVRKPNVKDYWSQSVLFGTPGISDIMAPDHFEDIRNNIHFIDDCDKSDSLYKIRRLIDHVLTVLCTRQKFDNR